MRRAPSRGRCVSACLLVAAAALSGAAHAGCASPALAAGLCDQNGDMVADAPADKQQWIDPPVLVIASVPLLGKALGGFNANSLLRHLQRALGRPVKFLETRDYAELSAAFYDHRAHIVSVNAGSMEEAVRCKGFVPLAQPIDKSGAMQGYRMEIVVPAASKVERVPQLRGHKITFVDETSASGFKLPRALLKREFGLEAGKDYTYEFSGRQDTSIIGVANGWHEAAPVADSIRQRLADAKLIEPAALRVIYRSQLLPRSPWGVSHRLNPALAARIQAAFVSYVGSDGFEYESHFRAANYKGDWTFMRELNAVSGLMPGCR